MNLQNAFLDLNTLGPGGAAFRSGQGWHAFRNPLEVLVANEIGQVANVVRQVEAHVATGKAAALVLNYEAGPAFDRAITTHASFGPFAWAALYRDLGECYRELLPGEADVLLAAPTWNRDEYAVAFEAVRRALEAGETYQVNLTFSQPFNLKGTAEAFFADRCGVDPPPYAAFLNCGDRKIASFSPELLFERTGTNIVTRPMKGTAPAPTDRNERKQAAEKLKNDPKSIAENVMIVDMSRSDLGAVCETGSVQTTQLLKVETHRGLLQMTSTVEGQSSDGLFEVLSHLFPAASITGAPRVETSRVIRDVEAGPRGVYCGAIGLVMGGFERFSVAIRTAEITGERGAFGIGSGVVWDSNVDDEYDECLAKREMLLRSGKRFELREAIGADRLNDVAHVDRHIARLRSSAERLGVALDEADLRLRLGHIEQRTPRTKVGIGLSLTGEIRVDVGPSAIPDRPLQFAVMEGSLQSFDPLIQFKTNARSMFDDALDAHPEANEVLMVNEHGLVAEFCYGNVVIELDGKRLTPRPESGCLPGIGVAEMVERGEAEFGDIPVSSLPRWKRVFFVNSVVGAQEAFRIEIRETSEV